MTRTLPRVVIIGGGFGGLAAAKTLRKADAQITLIDRRNHHLFQPLLYQVATAGLGPANIAAPIRRILRNQRNVEVLWGTADAIDADAKSVALTDGRSIPYDYLIIAAGATHAYFGRDEWESVAPGLKTIEDALTVRRRLLLAFERAENETDEAARQALLTFVIIGGGATGVEIAGAVAELAKRTLVYDFRRIDPSKARILLLERSDRVLSSFPPDLSEKARKSLEALGVEVRLGSVVTGIDPEGVTLGTDRIAARTVIWGAGVAASPLGKTLGVPLDRAGRVIAEPDLTIPGHKDVFIVGDIASFMQNGKMVPGVAPAAMQEGAHAAKNVLNALNGKPYKAFQYWDKGSLATIGRSYAVADFGKFRFSGFFAWFLWSFVHILFLVGFRNRLIVMFEWIWLYLAFERGSRLITEPARGDREAEKREEVRS